MAKKIQTVLEKPNIEQEVVEVTLADNYSKHTGILINGVIIEFTNGKAKVSKETSDKLKKQGFIK